MGPCETDVIAGERKRGSLLREVNARIREVSDRFGTADGRYRLLCECGREDCDQRLDVPVGDYDELRRRGEFLVVPAHGPSGSVARMPAFVPADPLRLQ